MNLRKLEYIRLSFYEFIKVYTKLSTKEEKASLEWDTKCSENARQSFYYQPIQDETTY